jgi:hypothetical protein
MTRYDHCASAADLRWATLKGLGEEAHPPAMMCMVLLLQGYVGASDAEAVEMAVMDLRWQMALDCLGASEPPFSQGALFEFRQRLIESGTGRCWNAPSR